ncbi:TRAP transporter large permease [Limnochorda pilosa]|uniref:TRAP dicarboxylate transporter subunit DctM n=1 Tax=Limnochorda pilosa TaxID=1555112 RepID=A0A0K2SJ58_LIMPI|nr:TRAP transporter large permease subunit [Limnochorda pilosa]BAS26874.1 TRAP dicarboxylate transporter subunit DctM [Limnochorda pilosa]
MQPTEQAGDAASPRHLSGKVEIRFTQAIHGVSAGLLVGIVLVISWQVIARYIPGIHSPRWTSEVSLVLMVWLAMIGSGLGIRDRAHLAMDVLVRQFPRRWRGIVFGAVWLVVAAFGVYLVIYGYELARRTMLQTFSASGMPIGWMYMGIPVGGLLITFYALRNAWKPPELDDEEVQANRRLIWSVLLGGVGLIVLGAFAVLGPEALSGPVGILLGSFVVMLLLGVPISVALGVAALLTTMDLGLPLLIVSQRMANGVNSIPLLAIPFFILAGQIMAEGGIAQRFVDVARVLVGPVRGGLAMVNVVDSMLFGGASGSAVADVSATGSLVIPMMKKKGYDDDFSVAITVASSTQGIIIPPSHNAVIYSLAAGGVSIGALFLSGYIPGIMIGLSLLVVVYILAVRRGYPSEPRPPLKESLRILVDAVPAMFVGLIIVGGVAFGFFTATESAAIGTLAALLVTAFIYRELTWKKLWRSIIQSLKTIATVILLIAAASAFAWLMAYLRIPSTLAAGLLSISDNAIVLLLMINVLLLILGTVMDMAPLILILTPVLLPIVTAPPINMDPVHFGIVMLINLGLGLTTPPVGSALFVGCAIGSTRIEQASRALLYLWPAMLVILLLVTYVPWFVNVLPGLVG